MRSVSEFVLAATLTTLLENGKIVFCKIVIKCGVINWKLFGHFFGK